MFYVKYIVSLNLYCGLYFIALHENLQTNVACYIVVQKHSKTYSTDGNSFDETVQGAVKGIGTQTILCAFYESLLEAEQFATNFMKINQGITKL